MTTATARTAELRQQASRAEPGKAFSDIIGAIFVAIGWAAGSAVSMLIFTGMSVRWGYRLGRGRDPQTGAVLESAARPAGLLEQLSANRYFVA